MELDLKTIEEEIAEIEAILTRVTPSYQSDGWVNSSGSNDKMVNGISRLIEKKKEYEKQWDALIDERAMAEKILFAMPNRLHATVIWLHYIKARRLKYIAVNKNISYRHLIRIHENALDDFRAEYEKVAHHGT